MHSIYSKDICQVSVSRLACLWPVWVGSISSGTPFLQTGETDTPVPVTAGQQEQLLSALKPAFMDCLSKLYVLGFAPGL